MRLIHASLSPRHECLEASFQKLESMCASISWHTAVSIFICILGPFYVHAYSVATQALPCVFTVHAQSALTANF